MSKLSIDTKIIHEIVKQIVQDKETTILIRLDNSLIFSNFAFITSIYKQLYSRHLTTTKMLTIFEILVLFQNFMGIWKTSVNNNNLGYQLIS